MILRYQDTTFLDLMRLMANLMLQEEQRGENKTMYDNTCNHLLYHEFYRAHHKRYLENSFIFFNNPTPV
jgi:hypothetical protein